jgi:hypothetical protein
MVFGRQADPVLFVTEPTFEPSDDPIVAAIGTPSRLRPFLRTLRGLAPRFWHTPVRPGNALASGYLYADEPNLAFTGRSDLRTLLVRCRADLDHRGGVMRHAKRTPSSKYVYEDGLKGRAVRLLLFDRIGTGAAPEPLHRDLEGCVTDCTSMPPVSCTRPTGLSPTCATARLGAERAPEQRAQLDLGRYPTRRAHKIVELRQLGVRKGFTCCRPCAER